MKSYLIPALGAALLLPSCSQDQPAPPRQAIPSIAGAHTLPKEPAQPRQYLALPGQPAQAISPTDTDAAFERQAAAYAAPQPAAPQPPEPQPAAPQPAEPHAPQPAGLPTPAAAEPTASVPGIPEPPMLQNPEPRPTPAITADPQPAPQQPAPSSADYAVQVTNGTVGRLFVEVQDDSGNVFPIAFMHAGQNISTPPMEPKPISGKLTVVIRDPDQPNAPELRRYKVAPPANYSGKTVGITILPGGQYRASLDGEVYYTSPAPEPPGQRARKP